MCDNFILNLFNSIETSDDTIFLVLVTNKRDDWEEYALRIILSQLITTAVHEHNKNVIKKKHSTDKRSSNKKPE